MFEKNGSLLRAIVDDAAIGMMVADLGGLIHYSNNAFNEMLGHDGKTDAVVSLWDLIHPDDDAAARQQLERLSRGEVERYRGEHRFRHNDGSPLWVMLAASLVRSGRSKTPQYLVVQLTGIERQRHAEEALLNSENRWNFALEGARQGVWDHDRRTNVTFYSNMWRIMRGIPFDEVLIDSRDLWLQRVHPDDREWVMTHADRQGQGEDGYDILEYRERHRDGHYVNILSRGRPVEWDEDGNALRTIGTDTDITHLKQIEQELAAEKQRLRITLDSIVDGTISTNAAGKIVFINPAAEMLTGWSSEQAIGRRVEEVFIIRAESSRPAPDLVQDCLDRGLPIEIENDMILVGKNGLERDIRCSAAPVRLPSGWVTGAVVVFQDITQSRALQRQLAHSAAHDDLTGLPNRASFERQLSTAQASARDGNREHTLLYLDLDRFKPVNDNAGHAAGDALLKQVALTIRGCCRAHDVAARIGGDEFAVLLQDCPASHGKIVADKIVRAVAALAFTWASKTYRIGISIGMTSIAATPASSLGLMGEADAACYAAKGHGRGQAVEFSKL
ncbi:MAG: PAS domain S-box protein [Devosia sp.]